MVNLLLLSASPSLMMAYIAVWEGRKVADFHMCSCQNLGIFTALCIRVPYYYFVWSFKRKPTLENFPYTCWPPPFGHSSNGIESERKASYNSYNSAPSCTDDGSYDMSQLPYYFRDIASPCRSCNASITLSHLCSGRRRSLR